MRADVVIVAVAACTPVGATAEASAAAIHAGISRIQADDDGAPLGLAGLLAGVPRVASERMLASGRWALAELDRKLDGCAHGPRPLLLGLPEPRPGWRPADAAAFAGRLLGEGRTATCEPLPLGHAAALEAVRRAKERIDRGDDGLVLIGGVDSYVDPDALLWLTAQRRRRNDVTRGGTIPGEAAAFVALMSRAAARHAGLAPLATVLSAASAQERVPLGSPEPALGEGLTRAVDLALARGPAVDEIFCDLNGERLRSEEWGFVALRLGHALRDPSRCHTAVTSCGDVGAAAGALALVACVQAFRRGHARGPRALVWGSSDGGLRTAVVLCAPEGGERWGA